MAASDVESFARKFNAIENVGKQESPASKDQDKRGQIQLLSLICHHPRGSEIYSKITKGGITNCEKIAS